MISDPQYGDKWYLKYDAQLLLGHKCQIPNGRGTQTSKFGKAGKNNTPTSLMTRRGMHDVVRPALSSLLQVHVVHCVRAEFKVKRPDMQAPGTPVAPGPHLTTVLSRRQAARLTQYTVANGFNVNTCT